MKLVTTRFVFSLFSCILLALLSACGKKSESSKQPLTSGGAAAAVGVAEKPAGAVSPPSASASELPTRNQPTELDIGVSALPVTQPSSAENDERQKLLSDAQRVDTEIVELSGRLQGALFAARQGDPVLTQMTAELSRINAEISQAISNHPNYISASEKLANARKDLDAKRTSMAPNNKQTRGASTQVVRKDDTGIESSENDAKSVQDAFKKFAEADRNLYKVRETLLVDDAVIRELVARRNDLHNGIEDRFKELPLTGGLLAQRDKLQAEKSRLRSSLLKASTSEVRVQVQGAGKS